MRAALRRPGVQDVLLAVALTGWNQWELTRAEFLDGAVALNHVLFAGMTASVALRRRAPLACAVVASAALAVQTVAGGSVLGTAAQFVALLVATHAVGSHADPRRAWAGLAVVLVGVEAYPFVSDEPLVLADEVGNLAVFVAVWALARAVRVGEDRRVQLAAEHVHREREAVERERARVARELHDIVAHGLSLMVLHSTAARVAGGAGEEALRSLQVVEDAGRQSMVELHRLLGMLTSADAENDGVGSLAELDDLCERMRTAGLAVSLSLDEVGPVDRSIQLSAYRVVQEALTNALRYAPSSHVEVRIARTADALEIAVRDDGARTAPAPDAAATGRGLRGLQARVELFGGSFAAGPRAGGWEVTAVLPATGAAVR